MVWTGHMCRHDLRLVDHGTFFCVPPLLGLVCKWHETMRHAWSLLTKSCVQVRLLCNSKTKRKHGSFGCLRHEMHSQLCLWEFSWLNDSKCIFLIAVWTLWPPCIFPPSILLKAHVGPGVKTKRSKPPYNTKVCVTIYLVESVSKS